MKKIVNHGYWAREAVIIILIFLVVAAVILFEQKGEQQFSYLAGSFLAGKTYFLEKPGTWADAVPFEGRYYRASGLLPAVLLVPGVWLWKMAKLGLFYQGYLQMALVIGVLGLVWMTARRLGWSKVDSWYWACAFGFASTFLGVAILPWGWHYAQVVTVFLWWLALYLFTIGKREWLVGLIGGGVFLTRSTAALGWIFFGMEWWRRRDKRNKLVWLGAAMVIAIVITGWYNWERFGIVAESGQRWVLVDPKLAVLRENGEFSVSHVARNVYYSFINGPRLVRNSPFVMADEWGMSVFVTAPYLLLWLIRLRKVRDRETLSVGVGVVAVAVPVLMFFSTGFRQMGSRYLLDFLPLVYWWCMKKLKMVGYQLHMSMRWLILLWAFVNLYFFFTVYFRF